MAKRIYALPDSKGIVRVGCGDEILEVVLLDRAVFASRDLPEIQEIITELVAKYGGNERWSPHRDPFEQPLSEQKHTFFVIETPGRVINISDVSHQLELSSRLHSPKAVLLRDLAKLDIHDAASLSESVETKWAETPIFVGFSDPDDG